jgi:hypothetical protein
MQRKLLGIINVASDATGQLLTICSAFDKYFRKMGIKRSGASILYRFQAGSIKCGVFPDQLKTS